MARTAVRAMRSRMSVRALRRERELDERWRAAADEAVRRALLNFAGLKVYDVWRDTGPDGDCDDVLFEQIRAVTPFEMKCAILGYAGECAVPDTYTVLGPGCASIRVRRR